MIEFLLDHLFQLVLYLLRIPLLNYLERFICYLFTKQDKITLDVLHKSNNFIIVNKPFDVLINSDNPKIKPTLQTLLRESYPDLANSELFHEFHFANRLDYSTSGVICIALNKSSCTAAVKAFEKRKADKYYLALIRGYLREELVDIDEGIGEDKRYKQDSHKMCVASDEENCDSPREASTKVLLLEKGLFDGKEASKVLIKPQTGRRHQIRVHCQYIGHPIIGDYTYGTDDDKEPYRMFLHSYRLVLPNDVEHLDILSKDPFMETDPKNNWTPTEVINKLDEDAYEKLKDDILNDVCKN